MADVTPFPSIKWQYVNLSANVPLLSHLHIGLSLPEEMGAQSSKICSNFLKQNVSCPNKEDVFHLHLDLP